MTDPKRAALPLHARLVVARDEEPRVMRLTRTPNTLIPSQHGLLCSAEDVKAFPGFAAYFLSELDWAAYEQNHSYANMVYPLPPQLSYLQEGDILRINPRSKEAWVMYRRAAHCNSVLLTERCNSWCIMCSQPPRNEENDLLLQAWCEAVSLMDPNTKELGITGGEPTLLGDKFLTFIGLCRENLPTTGLHVLSNGRLFNYLSFAQALAAQKHPDLMVGIPLYSDLAWQHDFIVQAPHAFDQTIRGLLNLARCGIRIELRVVIHRYSVDRLLHLATFIARNLPFVQQVALMGLEPIGFAQHNLQALWVDPVDYLHVLEKAVFLLSDHGMNVSIYNHQLCILPRELWSYARQSISDWKNIYLDACRECAVQAECGGFFHSASVAHSRGIHAIVPPSGLPVTISS